VTATAGIITAVTGLLVVLNQAGVFDTERNRVPQAQNATITSTEATKPLAVTGTGPSATESPSPGQTVPYPITLSAGAEVKLGDYVYKILAAQLDRDSAEKLRLRFTVRMMNNSGYGANFWDDTFRLLVDGVPRAPISNLNELVPSRSAKEGDVVFVIPEATKSTVLQVWSRGESTEIPIDIAAKPDLAEQRDRYSLIFVTEAAPNTALNSDAPNSGAPVSLAR
jgi:hypothetical protein